MQFENSLSFAVQCDKEDPLSHFRNEFIIPPFEKGNAIYFLGNSLGLQPKTAALYIKQILEQWSQYGVEAFFMGKNPWLQSHDLLIKPLSDIVGALPEEVVVMNQLSVNLHLMLASFYKPKGKRNKILCEAKAFPSDQYILETHLKQRGLKPEEIIIEVHPENGEDLINHQAIINSIEKYKEELALVFWGGVNYYSGQAFNIQEITKAAHDAGAIAGFDLAHAAGNILLELHNWDVDFACWCSYKYLNSGPGAIGGVFIHKKYHTDDSINRYGGWWGHKKEKRFLMEKGFDPTPSAEGWQLSTPSPILYACHKAALEVFEKATMTKIISKGKKMSAYLLHLLNDLNKNNSKQLLKIITPLNVEERGCQVSLLMPDNGKTVFERLTQKGVFADWREPDVIRIAPVPLYNTFEEIWHFARILNEALN
jgi:kynureninase